MQIRLDPSTGRERVYHPDRKRFYDPECCACGHIAEEYASSL